MTRAGTGRKSSSLERESGQWENVNNNGKYTVNGELSCFTFVYFKEWHYRHPQEVVQEQADGQR